VSAARTSAWKSPTARQRQQQPQQQQQYKTIGLNHDMFTGTRNQHMTSSSHKRHTYVSADGRRIFSFSWIHITLHSSLFQLGQGQQQIAALSTALQGYLTYLSLPAWLAGCLAGSSMPPKTPG
jgi:hypothetical protein